MESLCALLTTAGLLGSCQNGITDLQVEPPVKAPPAQAVSKSTPPCGTVMLTINNSSVSAAFPASQTCSTGLVLASGGAPLYVKTSRKLSLPVLVQDVGPEVGQPPIAQAEEPDTGRPAMPADWIESIDSLQTVPDAPDRQALYYRYRLLISFAPTASGVVVRDILKRYGAVIVGGWPTLPPSGAYIVSIPDPGPTFADLDAKISAIASEPGVDIVSYIAFRDRGVIRGR
jgi:hypothetical protein